MSDHIGDLIEVLAPAIEPITAWDFNDHARLDLEKEDELVDLYIQTARKHAERFCRRSFINTDWRLVLDSFPRSGIIILPRSPLVEVTSIEVKDDNGDFQTVDPADYQVDSDREPARICPMPGTDWITPGDFLSPIRVNFTAGYGDEKEDVPKGIRVAIMFLAAALFENREPDKLPDLPGRIAALLQDYRVL